MKAFLKQNFAIVLAFALPLLLIAGVALSTYLPSLFLKTDYDFVYATCVEGSSYYSYSCNDFLHLRYSVVDGKIVENDVSQDLDTDRDGVPDVNEYKARLFIHDTTANESREISLTEAESLLFSDMLTSPDGVTVSAEYDRGADFLLFGGGSSYGYYLTKGSSESRLNLIGDDGRYNYRYNFQFIGWVLPE